MGGGLMQLVAYGAQDIYLTGNPQITFFKVVYRRHTNFAMEAVEQTMNGTVATNGRTTVTISRNGDLVGQCYLQSTTPADEPVNGSISEINNVEVEIGGQKIDKQYGHWMEVWAELTENKAGLAKGTNFQQMSGFGYALDASTAMTLNNTAAANANVVAHQDMDACIVWVPLQFWFCRNPGLALPLIALQYHEVKLIFNFGSVGHEGHKVWCDYIYLDTDERRRFAQVSHEYLIEQVQDISVSASTSSQSVDLTFNHPVKELVWAGGLNSGLLTPFAGSASETVLLKLNGHDRFAAREARYFSRAQVWQHHSGEGGFVDMSIGVYSFALKPEEHQPSGTCNFSRIDNAQLVFSGGFENAGTVYAVNYNVLRVMSGMGGLAYSN
tara:strand:- start:109 stop:1257 length:1149 start_codon:yes stop_codon:yes gene_type:complete